MSNSVPVPGKVFWIHPLLLSWFFIAFDKDMGFNRAVVESSSIKEKRQHIDRTYHL